MMLKVWKDQRGVSPVIAVILMVAITVVLAGILYVWVDSLTEGTKEKPIPLLPLGAHDAEDCNPDDAAFYIVHEGGEPVDLDNYVLQVERKDQPGSTTPLSLEEHVSNASCTDNTWNAENHIIHVREKVYFNLPSSLGTIPDNLRIVLYIIDKDTDKIAFEEEVKIFYIS